MIYFDNAATTYPKPTEVAAAVNGALIKFGANPGRSGHDMSMLTAEKIYETRKKLSEFFGSGGAEYVCFTQNCTHAVNYALKGTLKPGDHVLISAVEHNAVYRPVFALSKNGISHDVVDVDVNDANRTVENFQKKIKKNTRMIAVSFSSNVFGIRNPVFELGKLSKDRNLKFLVDAAQGGGVCPIDMGSMNIDCLAIAGHKGLYGPMGVGALIVNDGAALDTIIEGGTGSGSRDKNQPLALPDRFESGTVNVSGICGLGAGVDFVNRIGLDNIEKHEIALVCHAFDRLSAMKHVALYFPRPNGGIFTPVLSFNINGRDSSLVAQYLNNANIAVRAGLHCAPLAHKRFGTLDSGTVRISPSVFSTKKEVDILCDTIEKIASTAL